MEIKGNHFGVRLRATGPDDPQVSVQLLAEDDGEWRDTGSFFSAAWLTDLMEVLKCANTTLQGYPKDEVGMRTMR